MSDPQQNRSTGTPIWCWLVALATIASCWGLAGWTAGLLSLVAGLSLFRSTKLSDSLPLFASSTGWALAMALTGDRRLFFPLAFWLATWALMHDRKHRYWTGVCAAIWLMTMFFLIRIQQGATGRVLWMELVVSITLGSLSVVLEGLVPYSLLGNLAVVVTIASLAAASLFV